MLIHLHWLQRQNQNDRYEMKRKGSFFYIPCGPEVAFVAVDALGAPTGALACCWAIWAGFWFTFSGALCGGDAGRIALLSLVSIVVFQAYSPQQCSATDFIICTAALWQQAESRISNNISFVNTFCPYSLQGRRERCSVLLIGFIYSSSSQHHNMLPIVHDYIFVINQIVPASQNLYFMHLQEFSLEAFAWINGCLLAWITSLLFSFWCLC